MGYDPLGLDQAIPEKKDGYDPLGLGPEEEKQPSYLEAAKVGLKEGLGGAMRMYEIPSRTILEKTGLAAPGTFASELLMPSEEEEKRVGELGIPGQIVRGVGAIPGAFAKYGPLMAAAPAGIVGTGLAFAGEKAAEELAAGKTPTPIGLAEEAVVGGIFRGIEPLKTLARSAILSGTFSAQAFGETYAQTKDLKQALEAAVAPGVIGAGMGLMGGKKGERPIPRPGEEEIRQIPTIPESRYQMGTPGYPRPEELPYPIVPYRGGELPVEMVWNPETRAFEPGASFQATTVAPGPPPVRGLPPGGGMGEEGTWKQNPKTGEWYQDLGRGKMKVEPSVTPDWIKEGREFPPPQYPPVIFTPKPSQQGPGTIKTPGPTLTPPQARKPSEALVAPLKDTQMAIIRREAEKVGGLSVDLIKRWSAVGNKRADAALEAMQRSGEIEPSPEGPYPWKLRAATPEVKDFFEAVREAKKGLAIERIEPSGQDLVDIVRKMGGLNPEDRNIDRKGLYEAGMYGKAGILKKTQKTTLDDMREDILHEAKLNPNITTDELHEMIRNQLEHRKEIAEAKGRGIDIPNINKMTEGELDRYLDQQFRRVEIYEQDQNLKPETINNLTKSIDDEIMGLKEQLYEEGFTTEQVSKAITKVGEGYKAEAPPADIAAIEGEIRSLISAKIPDIEGLQYIGQDKPYTLPDGTPLPQNHHFNITEEAATKIGVPEAAGATITTTDISPENLKNKMNAKIEEFKPAPSPTRPGEQLLPGMKVGLEMKGAKEGAAPTLEGTPLGEAARKAELEKVQPKLPEIEKTQSIPGTKTWATASDEMKAFWTDQLGDAETAENYYNSFKGNFEKAAPSAKPEIINQWKTIKPEKGDMLAVKAGDNRPITGLEEYMTINGVSVESIPKELLGGVDPKDAKIGYVNSEGNFKEIPKPKAEPISAEEEPAPSKTKPEARIGEPPKEPLSKEATQGFANERLKILKNAPETEILDTVADIPERIFGQLEENMRNGIKGVYDPMSKKIYLIREMLGSEEDVIRTIEHEAVSHYATEAYLGKDANPFFDRIYMKYGKSGLKDIADQRGFDLNTQEGRLSAAREKFAELTESGKEAGLIKQFIAWVRTQLAKLFPDMKISDAEIQATFMKAREALINGELRAREAKVESLRLQIKGMTGIAPEEGFKPAQFSIGARVKETGKAAYEEEIKPTGKGLWGAYEWIKKTVSPTSGVDVKDMDIMMKLLGEREMAKARIDFLTEKGIADLNKLSPQEQVDLIDKIQMGTRIDELPPNLREYARLHRWIEDSVLIKANEILAESDRASTIAYLEGHVRNFWKVVPRGLEEEIRRKGFEGLSRRSLEGTRAPLHHQYWTLKEGMANGGIPFTTNLLEITRLNYADTYQLLTAHDMWNSIGAIGHRKFIKFGEVTPEGFRPLNDRIANKYFPPKEAGRWVVEDNVGRILENHLSRDLVRENPALRGIMGIKNVTTALELGFSAFHASFITWETIASQIGLGMRKIWNQGMIEQGIKDILAAPISPIKTYKMGKDVARLFKTPDEFIASTHGQEFMRMFPEGKEMVGDLFWGGGSLRMSESYRINSLNTFKENLNSKNYIGAALRSIPALSQVMMKPLFENYIPSLKRAVFFKEFSNELVARQADLLSGKVTRPELARNVWSFVENRFGEMSFDNLWWNRTFKSSLQLVVRSVTWKLGNIRAYGKAATGQSAELLSAVKEGRMPQLTPEMAWVWGLAATTAAMASIAQYVFTGKTPENWKDLVYPQIDQQGGRLSLPTYMRDLFHISHAPLKYVSSSLAGWVGRFTDIVNNKDFYGTMVHDPNENIIQQRIDDLIHLAPLPFSIQSMKRFREEGEPASRQVAGFFGATKAPYWIERTDAEQKASDLKAAHLPIGGRTSEDFERGQLLKNYARKYQAAANQGESTDAVMRELHADIASGKLHMQDLLRFRQRIAREPLTRAVMNLPFRDILQVWSVATTEERKMLRPILIRKYMGLRSPEDRLLYRSKLREIMEENQ